MREKWFYDYVGARTVTALAQSLHEYTTGAADDMLNSAPSIAKALRHALDTWEPPSLERHAAYDAAVKALLVAALAELTAAELCGEGAGT